VGTAGFQLFCKLLKVVHETSDGGRLKSACLSQQRAQLLGAGAAGYFESSTPIWQEQTQCELHPLYAEPCSAQEPACLSRRLFEIASRLLRRDAIFKCCLQEIYSYQSPFVLPASAAWSRFFGPLPTW
jgi:hypothetical protein